MNIILMKFVMKFGVFVGEAEHNDQSINNLFINKSSFVVCLNGIYGVLEFTSDI